MWYPEGNEHSLSVRFNQCAMEVLCMRWLKGDLWKGDAIIIGMMFLLTLLIVVYALLGWGHQAAQQGQATGTIATETAKEQLIKLQRGNDRSLSAWVWNSGAALLSTLVIVIGGLFALWRWSVDRRDAQDKELKDRQEAQDKELRDRAEERFQTAVAALGNENEATQVGGAILLRSFLNKEDEKIYGRYYTQIFDLAVAYLRFRKTSDLRKDPIRQALVVVFKEAFPIVRNKLIADGADREGAGALPSLDASRIQLDHASLRWADLKQIWMPQSSLRKAILYGADLTEARLKLADLSGATLKDALSLKDTDLREVKGPTKEELEAFKARGAIIDEVPIASASQSPVSPPSPSPSSDVQTLSAPPAQVNTPPPSTDGSSSTSSQPSAES
jgi:hypothetical protein